MLDRTPSVFSNFSPSDYYGGHKTTLKRKNRFTIKKRATFREFFRRHGGEINGNDYTSEKKKKFISNENGSDCISVCSSSCSQDSLLTQSSPQIKNLRNRKMKSLYTSLNLNKQESPITSNDENANVYQSTERAPKFPKEFKRKVTPSIWFSLKEKHNGPLSKINNNVNNDNILSRGFNKTWFTNNKSFFNRNSNKKFDNNESPINETSVKDGQFKSNEDEQLKIEEDVIIHEELPKEALSCYEMFKTSIKPIEIVDLFENSSPNTITEDTEMKWSQSSSTDTTKVENSLFTPESSENSPLNTTQSDFSPESILTNFSSNEFAKSFFYKSSSESNEIFLEQDMKKINNIIAKISADEEEDDDLDFQVNLKDDFAPLEGPFSGFEEDFEELNIEAIERGDEELIKDNKNERIKLNKSKVLGIMKNASKKINNTPYLATEDEEFEEAECSKIIDVPVFRHSHADIGNIVENLNQGTIREDELLDIECSSIASEVNVTIKDSTFYEPSLNKGQIKSNSTIQFKKTAQLLIYEPEEYEDMSKSIRLNKSKLSESESKELQNQQQSKAILKIKQNRNEEQEANRAMHCDDIPIEQFIMYFESHEKNRSSAEANFSNVRKQQIMNYLQSNTGKSFIEVDNEVCGN